MQTISGDKATSINSQSVTNNCSVDIPIYISSVVENVTPTILEMTYNLNLANIVPATTAFYVLVNSVATTVDSVTINGANVLLVLDDSIVFGDKITVSYTSPASNPLQISSNGLAEDISNQSVTNNCQPAVPKYISSVVENDAPSILEMTYDSNLANIIPSASAFDVEVNSVSRYVNSVAIVDGKVQLTLASAIVFGDIITVDYNRPVNNPLQTSSGGFAASIWGQTVTNNSAASIPDYISSIVENDAPTILVMTYDLALANIVPVASAFNVKVNSVSITINFVSIVKGKVRLTLSIPVVYGDRVTVAYTIPATNPLQTSSGGLAASISSQSVTNNCQNTGKLNDPPILVVNYEPDAYSGFVYELDASGSYDINNDTLIFKWILPNEVPVSSTIGSKIQFLAPIVSISKSFEFLLSITDGEATVSKTIAINILPYKPEFTTAKITNIEASDYKIPDYPSNVEDKNLATKWSVKGDNQWLIITLAKLFKINYLEAAFLQGQEYKSFFDIYASIDKLNWDPLLINAASCDFSGNLQVFDIPVSNTNTEYAYVKLVGHGNELDSWNNFSEFKIFGIQQLTTTAGSTDPMKTIIYPNPANNYFTVSIEEPTMEPDLILIINASGKVVFEEPFNTFIKKIQIPDNLNSGIYIVELRSGSIILDTRKLIINR